MSDARCESAGSAPNPATCANCGAVPANEVSGRSKRIAWLMNKWRASDGAEKREAESRLLDAVGETSKNLCWDCATCGFCGLHRGEGLKGCVICGGVACVNCCLPALELDEDGKIADWSDNGEVICVRCNPPNGGSNAVLSMGGPEGGGRARVEEREAVSV